MKLKKHSISIMLILSWACSTFTFAAVNELEWPEIQKQNKPWTRWWWMGNAVDKAGLENQLTQLSEGGMGGVEICPIYGTKGYEDKFLDYLSPKWLEMFEFTVSTANKLDMAVDLTCGTGWPFGGPSIDKETASTGLIISKVELGAGQSYNDKLPDNLQMVQAVTKSGKKENLINGNDKPANKLNYQATEDNTTLYIVSYKTPKQRVKRAAPGSEGYVVNPYSIDALDHYLKDFNTAFDDNNSSAPRCFFHDSFEYYGADWSSDFFNQFKKLRGYDLKDYISELYGDGNEDTIAKVRHDYRQTISQLHINWIKHWDKWCNGRNSLSRNQAHGAPANLLDLYGASDIPETEIFRQVEDRQIPMLKFASSAAHLNGTPLASAEAYTWLSEHFQTPISKLKEATDFLQIAGINHVLFHGVPYSPAEAKWPGWQFYASVNFSPLGGIWHDLSGYNAYVARCQAMMQAGKSDNQILLYFPMADFWQTVGEKAYMPFTVHNEWMEESHFFETAQSLLNKGWAFDYISDDYITKASVNKGDIIINGNEYQVIVVPETKYMPVSTLQNLRELGKKGANIIFENKLPESVPGLKDIAKRTETLNKIKGRIQLDSTTTRIGNIYKLLPEISSKIIREECVDHGIDFNRRKVDNGWYYFLANRSDKDFNSWIKTGRSGKGYVFMNPLYDNVTGVAKSRTNPKSSEVLLQLKAGESVIVKVLDSKINGNKWPYYGTITDTMTLDGKWDASFIDGGPELPASFTSSNGPAFWTNRDDANADKFAGTASYTCTINWNKNDSNYQVLDLGNVCNSARVFVNDNYVATSWATPFEVLIGPYLIPGENKIEIQVTNLAANRIRDMDINKVNWKYFYDINVVNINYKPFDASGWPIMDSGLAGPVNILTYSIYE